MHRGVAVDSSGDENYDDDESEDEDETEDADESDGIEKACPTASAIERVNRLALGVLGSLHHRLRKRRVGVNGARDVFERGAHLDR